MNPINCQRDGCCKLADGVIAINVPATGIPIQEHDPLRVVFGLHLCDQHIQDEMKTGEAHLTPELRQIFEMQARWVNGRKPDFRRTFITKVEFTSQEYQVLTKNKKGDAK